MAKQLLKFQTHFHRFWVPQRRHDDWFEGYESGGEQVLIPFFPVAEENMAAKHE